MPAESGGPSARMTIERAGLFGLPPKPSVELVEGCLRNLAESLDRADPLRRRAVREITVRTLRSVGCTNAAALVDAALGHDRKPAQDLPGHALMFPPEEPWRDPVDGAELLEDLASTFRRYVALPNGAAETLALWNVFAHALEAFEVAPLLVLTSPEKRCGKTRTIGILSCLVPRKLPTSHISPAALFRIVEKAKPTLLVDEADSFLRMNEELRGILNSGHTRDAAFAVRTVGEDFEPRRFSTWSPKAVALIGRLPDTLMDRAVVIPLRRRAPRERVARVRSDRLGGELAPLRRKVARWAADHLEALRNADPQVPESLHDRAADNWRPLLAIADRAGGAWPALAREAARALSGGDVEAESLREQILADVRAIFREAGVRHLRTKDLLEKLHALEARPWAEYKLGKPLSPRQLANLLRPFGVGPQTLPDGSAKGYAVADFEDSFLRYLPSEPSIRQDPRPERAAGNSESVRTSPFDGCAIPPEAAPRAELDGLTDTKGGDGRQERVCRDCGGRGWRHPILGVVCQTCGRVLS